MEYQRISVEPISSAIGALIGGVDLREDLDDQTISEIERALLEHLVVFFRDQAITPAQHKAFGRRFGDFHIHPLAVRIGTEAEVLDDHPEIIVLESDEHTTVAADRWHCDVSYDINPPMGSILHARIVPPVGGDTTWTSMYAAYEALSSGMQRITDELSAVHEGLTPRFVERQMIRPEGPALLRELRDVIPQTVHPVVRTHPVSGKRGLFVNEVFTKEIDGMKPAESNALLDFLYEHFHSPEFQVRFRWEVDSIAFWDNRCTLHYAVNDFWPHRRRMQRVTLAGDRPR